ncbi:N-acetylmuramoyl-L-alanine amidase [Phaeobacter porticola]|uniref:N-acetylmuramoyl-L-alanine amidase n=1 Tax=Phaeobacter porticola TaxID=1844006 RepID=A0A1L3I5P8_9RHOB|nr:N-acetylmuramoyl-L-alanine amidase [Phaeobacter porticola]APG47436.1 putative N-acetylmuramoyl-L-alanine amidase AmiC [Phaeobacter porticola]
MNGLKIILTAALVAGSALAITGGTTQALAQVGGQGFSGLARIEVAQTSAKDSRSGAGLTLGLSQGVPYRLFTLDGPPRVVMDFQEVDWGGLEAETLITDDGIKAAQFGTYVPGWSRLVLELARPMQIETAAMNVDPVTADARLTVALRDTTAEEFAAHTGAPNDARWDLPAPTPMLTRDARDSLAPLLVVIDPGHGGIDPGAEAFIQGRLVQEKDLMLQFAIELGEMLVRSGQFNVQLTRDDDYFVSLERRIALAHQAKADLFLSLHADSLSEGLAHGTTVYVLSKDASDAASATLVERHERGDLLAGTDLSQADDRVTDVLLDLARLETHPRSEALAGAMVSGLKAQGGAMNRRPLREAGFSVLKSADIPSVLVEIGFLSSPRDLANLMDAAWRENTARGILNGLLSWRIADESSRSLVRQ